MHRSMVAIAALAALAGCTQPAPTATTTAAPDPAAIIARGEYFVESIGMCGDCHTLRLPTGLLDKATHLHGTAVPFAPLAPQPWAPQSPPLAGLPKGYDEAQLTQFLQTGVRPDGSRPLPPMPEYRFTAEDAAAVTAYLKSLPAPPAAP